jgi:hypothetical protein
MEPRKEEVDFSRKVGSERTDSSRNVFMVSGIGKWIEKLILA